MRLCAGAPGVVAQAPKSCGSGVDVIAVVLLSSPVAPVGLALLHCAAGGSRAHRNQKGGLPSAYDVGADTKMHVALSFGVMVYRHSATSPWSMLRWPPHWPVLQGAVSGPSLRVVVAYEVFR